jgi:NADH dehydrogenase
MAHRVVIVGGGFGGLTAAQHLRTAPVAVTLIDRRNFHLFQPLLYQVATGGLSPADIASPLRAILQRQRNTHVLLGEVLDFDVTNHQVLLGDGAIPYDTLIVASGSSHHYFGHEQWAEWAPGLKTIEDATVIRRRILSAFESAEREADLGVVPSWLTFVIVGGGPTGVELAGAVAELARHTLRRDFRNIDPASATILLVEAAPRILAAFPPELAARAEADLARLGVTVRTGVQVMDVGPHSVTVRHDNGQDVIPARTVLWAAGVQASPLGRKLADATGAALDRAGRVTVAPDLSVPGYPDVFVIGDLALFTHQNGQPLPGVAPVAIQQGKYVAKLLKQRLQDNGPAAAEVAPFHYHELGKLATIGRAAAVADFGRIRLHGWIAWLVWLFVHLMQLVGFENRLLVFTQWAWNYVTRNQAARLITGPNALVAAKAADPVEKVPTGAGSKVTV